MNILVVDDSKLDRLIATTVLRNAGHVVSEASDGHQALEFLAKQTDIDLVLIDLSMPNMDGLQLLKRMNQEDSVPLCAVMTASEAQTDAIEALRRGAFDFIVKPCTGPAIAECLRRAQTHIDNQGSALIPDAIQESLQVTFDSRRRAIPQVVRRVMSHPNMHLMSDRGLRNEVKLALVESLNNAVIHGNFGVSSAAKEAGDWQGFEELVRERENSLAWSKKQVRLEVQFGKDHLSLIVTDEGSGFDTTKLPVENEPSELAVSGRGVMLIRHVMDQVVWNRSGNQLLMVKRFQEQRGDQALVEYCEKAPEPSMSVFA